MSDAPVIQALEKYRNQLAIADAQALGRLADAWHRAYSRLTSALDALLAQIGDSAPTAGQLARMTRYKRLMEQAMDELMGLQSLTTNEVERAAELGVSLGEQQARELVSTALVGTPEIAGTFNQLPVEVVKTLLGFLDPTGPLYAQLQTLAPYTAGLVADAITSGVAMGMNPQKIARLVQDAFGGGLTDAMRFCRTVQNWSYRESSRASYAANDNVIQGWIWSAALDDRVCMACASMHGSFHPISEKLNGHHNCRCAMIPAVIGFDRVIEEGAGEEWFKGLPEAKQRDLMGKSKHEAWKAGKFEFSQLSTTHTDKVYGEMRTEAALKDLVHDSDG